MENYKADLKKAASMRPEAQQLLDLAEHFRKYRWKDGRKTKVQFCHFDTYLTRFDPVIDRLFSWEIEEEDKARIAMHHTVVKTLPSCHNCSCGWEQERPLLEDHYWDLYEGHYDISKTHRQKREEFNALKKKPEFQADILAKIKEQNFLCFYCNEHLNNTYHIDHRLPSSKGGSNNLKNLVISCSICNLKKNDFVDEEFSLDPEYVNWVSLVWKEAVWMPVLTV